MSDVITSTQTIESRDVIDFLNDVRQNSVTEILEGKEVSDLIDIAKKSGIKLKDNTDLAGFKNVYALVDKANKNRCRLPREIVEKNIASLNGKPVDIDHLRNYVVGHHLQAKIEGNKIINYGVFYKSNFDTEFEELKKLFKAKKLNTSFEIHCAPEDRDYHKDGSYSLKKMEFAGSGILFKTSPAEPEAKVLELAKKHMDKCSGPNCDLIYSSEDLITSTIDGGFECSCVKCGHKMTLKDGEHCADKKCPECGGQMRRADRPGPGRAIEETIENSAIPKEVQSCVKRKVKEGKKFADAIKECWKEFKKKQSANIDTLLYEIEDKEEANKKDMKELEISLNVFDIDLVYRMVSGLYCPKCKEDEKTGYLYLIGTDYENKKAFLRCDTCKSKYSVNLVLKPKVEKGKDGNLGKGVPKAKKNAKEGGDNTVDEKIKKDLAEKAKKLGLAEDATKEQVEAKEKEIKEAAEKDKDTKIKDLEIKIAALEKSLKDGKVDVEKIKADAIKVAKLREELGKYAKDKDGKDLKDEDLLDEKKVEAIKGKKENDELKAKVDELNKKIEKAGIKEPDVTGHSDKTDVEEASEETKEIDRFAYKEKE